MAKLIDLEATDTELAELEITDTEYPMEGTEMSLGRAPNEGLDTNDISLPSIKVVYDKFTATTGETRQKIRAYLERLQGVSKQGHLTFTKKNYEWYVSSKAGRSAYIGGEKITEKTKLANGTEIGVGAHKYRLMFEAE